ncbi:MAG: pilus assembly protein PilM [Oscillospiraceae bacterium]
MNLNSKGKALNIEVGDRLTKVCLSIPKGKSYQIKSSFMFQTPDNAVTDGNITAPELLAAKLSEELALHELADTKNVVFALTSSKVASREVMLPPVKDNRIKGIVDSNAADYFPVDLSKYHVTYSLLERTESGENAGCRVLVMAVPLTLLETYFILAEQAKLTVQAIDFSGNSQYQALKTLDDESVTMYVNADCNSSYISFMQNGTLLLQRTFTFGGDELILSYLSASDRSGDEYVAALHDCSAAEPEFLKNGLLRPLDVTENLSRLVSSIIRSSDYFNSNHWDMQVENVVLMGPCSHLTGLMEMVANGTGLPTTYLDSIPGITSFANEADSASFYISCIGCSIEPLDFIPPQFKTDKKKNRKNKVKSDEDMLRDGAIICGACLLVALILSAVSLIGYSSARREKADLEQQIAELQYVRDIYTVYLQYQAGADALTALSDGIASPNDSLTAFIDELESKMPSQLLLLSAACAREGVIMNITVPTFEDVAVVLVQLRSFESIGDITISSATQETDDAGITNVSFSVSCAYKLPETAIVDGAATDAALTEPVAPPTAAPVG